MKFAGSIPADVIGILHRHKFLVKFTEESTYLTGDRGSTVVKALRYKS